ncbi:MAG: amidohydrolase [Cyclobacteriaceae bacterium]
MKIHRFIALLLVSTLVLPTDVLSQKKPKPSANKQAAIASIEQKKSTLVDMSDQIWGFAEMSFEETNSSKLLSDYAASQGFTIQKGVADIPTAFIASYGSGNPIIGILGEFDALPGLSQKASPNKEPAVPGAPGHGCGHNMFGVGSMGAAVAIKELIEAGKLKGTIRFYGTPAEERYFGKLFLARAGLFNDLDACFDWHPSNSTKAGVQSSLALVDFEVEFRGQTSHAALDPWNGRSAVDAMELYTTGINYLREHIRPTVRVHYMMQNVGNAANIVPDYAKIWTRVRDDRREGMVEVWKKVERIAKGAALMADVDYDIKLISGIHEILVNRTGGAAMQKNLEMLGDITYTPEEVAFAKQIQKNTGVPETGLDGTIKPMEETLEHPGGASSDVGDVSWLVPEITFRGTTMPAGSPGHSWAVVACGGMSIGHKGMIYAAKALSMTMIDVFEDAKLLEAVKNEFLERKGDYVYKAFLPEGPPPIPNSSKD